MDHYFSYKVNKEYQYFHERFSSDDYDSENRFPIKYSDKVDILKNTPIRKEYFIGGVRRGNYYNKYRGDSGAGSSICPICRIDVVKYYTSNINSKGW